ncbi:glycosyltransferase family 4 protein [Winogradskyella aquimaris]|uniref:Glycosyltransferase family 4 protein n=1 Tax=Winogradskyella aquimaris TaxID=864074 RepID=A0ABU5ELL9_9FLAO|nr:glycosyltransferase family 4 protein [Winogradskyella aquimaris]MDY2587168.1 glycosyltransferase family 4 protein [Winogradskyella aquimaris]
MIQKVAIIGPIGDFGGRELETGFIAKTLSEDSCEVSVVSTARCTSKSQIFEFIKSEQLQILDELVIKRNLLFRFIAKLAYLRSHRKNPLNFYSSNKFSKKLGYKSSAIKVLNHIVEKADLVIICAQISSAYVKEIVEFAFDKQIPLIIRTSSKISENDIKHKDWLEKVTLFFHHSESNAKRLSFLNNHDYKIIDQCTFKEEEMLEIECPSSFKNILFIGRLSPEKGVVELVNYFKVYGKGLCLNLIGDGPLYNKIATLTQSVDNINLLGYKSQEDIITHFKKNDTIIISSFKESGPLVGLEAMASARLIISTKVGAMSHRLSNTINQFWLDINDPKSLEDVFIKMKGLTEEEIRKIAEKNREVYLLNYRKNTLENLYKKSIFNLLKAKPTV